MAAGRLPRPSEAGAASIASGGRRTRSPEELERLCGSPDHQGVVAEVDPYPYADPGSLLEAEDALVVVLDQVQDPHNLGPSAAPPRSPAPPGW